MKYLFVTLFFLSSLLAHSQQYRFDHNENIKAIYEFELKHTNEIREATKGDTLVVLLDFNTTGVLTGIRYFDSETSEGLGSPAKVWDGLDTFIKELYPFGAASEFSSEFAYMDHYLFRLPVKKEDIKKAADFMQNDFPKQQAKIKEEIKKKYGDNEKIVVPNMKFTLMVNQLELDGIRYPQKQFKASLRYLDSGMLRLSPDCYMIFKVMNTSENGEPKNYLEYKLFKIQKDAGAMLYIKENYVSFTKGKARLKQNGYRSFVSDEGDMEEGKEHFNFDLQLTFE